MKILIVTDAWPPVTSGVVRTYQTTIRHLKMMGHHVDVITPDQFFTVRCPTDNQQRLALYAGRKTGRLIEAAAARRDSRGDRRPAGTGRPETGA